MKSKYASKRMHDLEILYEIPWAIALISLLILASDLSGIMNWLAILAGAESYKGGIFIAKILIGFVGLIFGSYVGHSFWKSRKCLLAEWKKLDNLDKAIYLANKEKNFIEKLDYRKATNEDWQLFEVPILGVNYLSNDKIKEILIIRLLFESSERGRKLFEEENQNR